MNILNRILLFSILILPIIQLCDILIKRYRYKQDIKFRIDIIDSEFYSLYNYLEPLLQLELTNYPYTRDLRFIFKSDEIEDMRFRYETTSGSASISELDISDKKFILHEMKLKYNSYLIPLYRERRFKKLLD